MVHAARQPACEGIDSNLWHMSHLRRGAWRLQDLVQRIEYVQHQHPGWP